MLKNTQVVPFTCPQQILIYEVLTIFTEQIIGGAIALCTFAIIVITYSLIILEFPHHHNLTALKQWHNLNVLPDVRLLLS